MKIDVADWQSRVLRTPEELQAVCRLARGQNMTVVTTNGCFDLLHRGHIHILSEAAALGDVLIVGLNSDRSVRMSKGEKRPFVPELERAEILLGFEGVDYVYIYDDATSEHFVELARPDVHVNDASYGENCVESVPLRKHGGKLHLVEKIDCPSTTDIIGRVLRNG